jgi:DNA-binding SARP family transcriptional activator
MTIVDLRPDPSVERVKPVRPDRIAPSAVRLSLLGGFELVVDGEPVRIPESSERLVVFLALRDRPQPRLLVAGYLWPEKTDQRALANLRTSLWRCRIPDGYCPVVAIGSRLCLARQVRVDVTEMEATAWALLKEPAIEVIDRVDRTMFYRELLPGWYDDWVVLERERLSQLQMHWLEQAASLLASVGRMSEADDLMARTDHANLPSLVS